MGATSTFKRVATTAAKHFRLLEHPQQYQSRGFAYTTAWRSGHNRWSKIRHDKAKEDAVKSKERTLLSQEILFASKYGGSDPTLNPRLALAITNAKRGQLSKTSIESAILKGQGKSVSGAPLELVTVEAMLPYGVATILECHTEQKARVLQDMRLVVNRNGGTVTPTAFLFDKKGKIWFENENNEEKKLGVDEAMDEAIEAGAQDIELDEDGRLVVETDPSDVTVVASRIREKLGLHVHRTEILFVPKQDLCVVLSDEQGAELQKILDLFGEEPSLQNLYVNAVPQS